jgi:hypothetical protein
MRACALDDCGPGQEPMIESRRKSGGMGGRDAGRQGKWQRRQQDQAGGQGKARGRQAPGDGEGSRAQPRGEPGPGARCPARRPRRGVGNGLALHPVRLRPRPGDAARGLRAHRLHACLDRGRAGRLPRRQRVPGRHHALRHGTFHGRRALPTLRRRDDGSPAHGQDHRARRRGHVRGHTARHQFPRVAGRRAAGGVPPAQSFDGGDRRRHQQPPVLQHQHDVLEVRVRHGQHHRRRGRPAHRGTGEDRTRVLRRGEGARRRAGPGQFRPSGGTPWERWAR